MATYSRSASLLPTTDGEVIEPSTKVEEPLSLKDVSANTIVKKMHGNAREVFFVKTVPEHNYLFVQMEIQRIG